LPYRDRGKVVSVRQKTHQWVDARAVAIKPILAVGRLAVAANKAKARES